MRFGRRGALLRSLISACSRAGLEYPFVWVVGMVQLARLMNRQHRESHLLRRGRVAVRDHRRPLAYPPFFFVGFGAGSRGSFVCLLRCVAPRRCRPARSDRRGHVRRMASSRPSRGGETFKQRAQDHPVGDCSLAAGVRTVESRFPHVNMYSHRPLRIHARVVRESWAKACRSSGSSVIRPGHSRLRSC